MLNNLALVLLLSSHFLPYFLSIIFYPPYFTPIKHTLEVHVYGLFVFTIHILNKCMVMGRPWLCQLLNCTMQYRLIKNTLNSLWFFFFFWELHGCSIFNRQAERRIVQQETLCLHTRTLFPSGSLFIYLFLCKIEILFLPNLGIYVCEAPYWKLEL